MRAASPRSLTRGLRMLRCTLALLSLAALAQAATPVHTDFVPEQGPHPFGVHDLVMLERVSDAQISPDGRLAAFSVRHTEYAKNKGVTAVYVLDLHHGAPVKVAAEGSSPRWAPN